MRTGVRAAGAVGNPVVVAGQGRTEMNAGEIARRVAELDDGAADEVSKALEAGLDPVELLRAGVIRGLERIGE